MHRHVAQPRGVLDLLRTQLPEADLRALAHAGTEFRCPARWPLLVEGTPAHDLYVIGRGTADIYRSRRKVARIGAGEVVGECALWSTGLRSATVSAVTELQGVRVPYARMPELFDRSDRLASMVLTTALERACAQAPSDLGGAAMAFGRRGPHVAAGLRSRRDDVEHPLATGQPYIDDSERRRS